MPGRLSSNVTEGYAPLYIQFTDLSQNTSSWEWDFENDGKVDSINKTDLHVYTIPENYTVRLTTSNENGKVSK
jgi:PKD repeat protein